MVKEGHIEKPSIGMSAYITYTRSMLFRKLKTIAKTAALNYWGCSGMLGRTRPLRCKGRGVVWVCSRNKYMGGADIWSKHSVVLLSLCVEQQPWIRSKNMIKTLEPGLKSPEEPSCKGSIWLRPYCPTINNDVHMHAVPAIYRLNVIIEKAARDLSVASCKYWSSL